MSNEWKQLYWKQKQWPVLPLICKLISIVFDMQIHFYFYCPSLVWAKSYDAVYTFENYRVNNGYKYEYI